MASNDIPKIDHDIEQRLKHILNDMLNPLISNIKNLIKKYDELKTKFNEQTKKLGELNKDNIRFSKDLVEKIKKEKNYNDEIKKLFEEITTLTTTQQMLESQRNVTVNEMNKTADKIISDLNNISGSIAVADSSSGGRAKTKKRFKPKKRNKKMRTKRMN